MPNVRLRYLEVFHARGSPVAFYRRDGVRVRLRTPAGAPVDPRDAPALVEAWTRAHEAHERADREAEAASGRVRPRSIADLIGRYRASPEWREKKPQTRRDYEKGLAPLDADWGHLPVSGLQRRHVTVIRNRYAQRTARRRDGTEETVSNARQANRVVTVLSILMSYAQDPLGWRKDNPALRPRRLKQAGEGYRAWTPEEFTRFSEASGAEWRFAALLALTTTQRGQDLVAMRWRDWDGESLRVVQQKGRKRVQLRIQAHPLLRAELERRRAALCRTEAGDGREEDRADRAIMVRAGRGGPRPWTINAFQKAAGQAIRAAGLSGVVWHGLRAAGLSWAAEQGASDKALQALAGHATSQMTARYTRAADQKRLAAAAVGAIVVPIRKG